MTSGNTVSYSIKDFLNKSKEEIVGVLKEKNQQTRVWEIEIEILKYALKDYEDHEGKIIFEYGIPGFRKVVDVIILVGNYILILEYKTGQQTFASSDIDQVLGYAYRIKYFHCHSKDKKIIPVLVATEATESLEENIQETEDGVFKLIKTNTKGNKEFIQKIMHEAQSGNSDWHKDWENGIFKESPDIIQYITRIWNENEVEGLDNNKRKNIVEALQVENKIHDIIEKTKNNQRKALIFITGVPGAGKTLVGLNVAIQEKNNGSSFLSGNAPLVEVLTAALVRNLKSKKKKVSSIEQIKDEIASGAIVRNVFPHKEEIIKRLDYSDPENIKFKKGAEKSSQKVVIYDEAQRAWSVEKMRKPGRSAKDWQTKEWRLSEPSLLLWDIDKLDDWGVFICLVGGGQEINDGETGLNEWLRTFSNDKTLIDDHSKWDIYIPSTLSGNEYQIKDKDGKTFNDYLASIKEIKEINIYETDELHLTQCQRTPLSSELSEFINKLVEGAAESSDYDKFKERYPIAITRNIQTAKDYIRKRQKELQPLKIEIKEQQESSELLVEKKLIRGGMLMSSSALRLRAIGYPVKKVIEYLSKTPAWFLDTREENIDSSDFLEVALNEFFVQGLEIDLGCVMWDGDFRFVPSKSSCTGSWEFHKFNKKRWSDPIEDNSHKNHLIRTYMRNAYRVLLTRSRLGLVICIPLGDKNDPSRQPEIYDNTYTYLKNLGFLNLDNLNS